MKQQMAQRRPAIGGNNARPTDGIMYFNHPQWPDKYSLLMHCIKIKSSAKFLLIEQYVFVGGNISFLCVLSCSSEEA